MNQNDLLHLKKGIPPESNEAIELLTLKNDWLDNMEHYCLDKIINHGGCKVKILYGDHFTGKSHYLLFLNHIAQKNNFLVVSMNVGKIDFKITDIVSLYKKITESFNFVRFNQELLNNILLLLGYEDFSDNLDINLCNFICEKESAPLYSAKQSIRKVINQIVKDLDISFSFKLFLMRYMEALSENDQMILVPLQKWLLGEKLDNIEKRQCQLFEKINKQNARIWLYSFSEIIKLANYQGLVLLFDQFESVLPSFESQINYTSLKRNDLYELLRQLIDDLDFLKNFLIVISTHTDMITNEKYGFESYHALWMRIQPCYSQKTVINPYADLIDANLIMKLLINEGKMEELDNLLKDLFSQTQFNQTPVEENSVSSTTHYTDFRSLIIKHSQNHSLEG